jgi:DNA-binding NarL/FixJ family response regulator
MDEQVSAHLPALSRQILVRVTNGEKVKKIASELGTTRDVVDGQIRRIYQHFRVRGIAQLVHAAIREGWIEHPAENS